MQTVVRNYASRHTLLPGPGSKLSKKWVAWGCVGKKWLGFKDTGKRETLKCYRKLQNSPPTNLSLHIGWFGVDSVTAACTKPPSTTCEVAHKQPRSKNYSVVKMPHPMAYYDTQSSKYICNYGVEQTARKTNHRSKPPNAQREGKGKRSLPGTDV